MVAHLAMASSLIMVTQSRAEMQLQDIVRQTDQRPLALDLAVPRRKLAESRACLSARSRFHKDFRAASIARPALV